MSDTDIAQQLAAAQARIADLTTQLQYDGEALNRMQEAGLEIEGAAGALSKMLGRIVSLVGKREACEPFLSAAMNQVDPPITYEEFVRRQLVKADDLLKRGVPAAPKPLPSVVLSRFRWMSFLEGNPRIQEVEFNTGLYIQILNDDLPPDWEGKFSPEWFPISELPNWVRLRLNFVGAQFPV